MALHCTDSFKLSDRYFILTEAGRMRRDWRLVVVVATLVVPPTMVVVTAVPFMTFAPAVCSILVPPIWAFAPPASTLPPETSARPESGQKQEDQEFSHLKPYLSVCASSPRWR